MRLIRNTRAGARLRADREDSETTCQRKGKKRERVGGSTDAHTRVHKQTHAGAHAHTHARKHAAAVTRVCGDRHGDQTTFCVLSCETPQEYSMTGSRDPGTVGVSCLCLTRILFIILFCNGGKKFAAKDQPGLIISTLAEELGGGKVDPPAAFSSAQTFQQLGILQEREFKNVILITSLSLFTVLIAD